MSELVCLLKSFTKDRVRIDGVSLTVNSENDYAVTRNALLQFSSYAQKAQYAHITDTNGVDLAVIKHNPSTNLFTAQDMKTNVAFNVTVGDTKRGDTLDMRVAWSQALQDGLSHCDAAFSSGRGGGKVSDDTKQNIRDLRKAKMSDEKIAKILKVKLETVKNTK